MKGALGVFFCYALPALDKEIGDFTEEAGTTRWYLYDIERDAIYEEPGEIVQNFGAVGFGLEGKGIIFNGLVEPAYCFESKGELSVNGRKIRFYLQGFFVVRDSFSETFLLEECIGQIFMR